LRNWPRVRRDGFTRGAGHRGHLFVRQQQRKAVFSGFGMLADLMRQLDEQPRQARGHGLGQRNAAGILQTRNVLLADALHGAQLGFLVAAQEGEKTLALDGAQLRRCERLRGDLIHAVRKHRIQAPAWSRGRDAARSMWRSPRGPPGQLEIAAANEIQAAGIFACVKSEACAGNEMVLVASSRSARTRCQGAKPPGRRFAQAAQPKR